MCLDVSVNLGPVSSWPGGRGGGGGLRQDYIPEYLWIPQRLQGHSSVHLVVSVNLRPVSSYPGGRGQELRGS